MYHFILILSQCEIGYHNLLSQICDISIAMHHKLTQDYHDPSQTDSRFTLFHVGLGYLSQDLFCFK